MASIITVEGLPELEAKLLEFDAKVRPGLLRATRPGAKLLQVAIQAEAPVGQRPRPSQGDVPGNLRASVRYKASRKRSGFTGEVVAPYGKGSAHRYLVIAGHRIKGHARVRLGKYETKGGLTEYHHKIGRKGVSRSGEMTTPNDFVRRGRMAAEGPALAATEAAVAAAIEAAVKL